MPDWLSRLGVGGWQALLFLEPKAEVFGSRVAGVLARVCIQVPWEVEAEIVGQTRDGVA